MGTGIASSTLLNAPYCRELLTWEWGGILIFDFILSIPTTLFFLFLLMQLRKALNKLYETESLIMSTYYGFLWGVCIFNIARCLLDFFVPIPLVLFEVLYLIANGTVIFIEVSVVVFMSHGYAMSGREAIQRTLWITGILCGLYVLVQAILMFGVQIHLYTVHTGGSALYWMITCGIFAIVYATLLILTRTSFRDRLPAPAFFYYYIGFLLALNAVKMIGYFFVFFGADIGFCFIDLQLLLYFSSYAPVLYICFLKDFFKEVVLPEHYMEMHKNNFLDSDT